MHNFKSTPASIEGDRFSFTSTTLLVETQYFYSKYLLLWLVYYIVTGVLYSHIIIVTARIVTDEREGQGVRIII